MPNNVRKRSEKGKGSITKVREGAYRVKVELRPDPISGKRKCAVRVVTGTLTEARKLRDEIIAQRDSGLAVKQDMQSRKTTFGEFARAFHEERLAANKCSYSHMRAEEHKIKVICRYWENVPLNTITDDAVIQLCRNIKTDEGICDTTLKQYYIIINMVLKKAVRRHLIALNPCDVLDKDEKPQARKPNRKSLKPEEYAALREYANKMLEEAYSDFLEKEERQRAKGNTICREYVRFGDLPSLMCIQIELTTGLRLGEVLGLTWEAVTLISGKQGFRGSLTVKQAVSPQGIKQPKTKSSIRTISLSPDTVQTLLRWKKFQARFLKELKLKQTAQTPICSTAVGGFMDACNFEKYWNKFRTNAGFPKLKFHELRHTNATLLISGGTDIKVVQERLGHKSATTTLDFYAHALPERDEAAASLMDKIAESYSANNAQQPKLGVYTA
jgi:integrase